MCGSFFGAEIVLVRIHIGRETDIEPPGETARLQEEHLCRNSICYIYDMKIQQSFFTEPQDVESSFC